MAEETENEAGAVDETLPAEENVAEAEETEVQEELPSEPKDNAERSKLGRKVQELELNLQQALDTIKQLSVAKPQQGISIDDDINLDDDEEISFRKGDLRKEIVNVISKTVPRILDNKNQAQVDYERKVLIAVSRLGSDLTDDEFGQVAQRIEKKFNRYTGNPELDARTNFLEAQVELLRGNKGKKKNPLKGEAPKAPLGGGGGETPPSKKNITLSTEMKALQKKYNLSDEAAIRAAKQIK